MQELADITGQPLAHDDLQTIAQRDHPTLAAQCTHLSDMIQIDDRIAVDAPELLFLETLLDYPQGLGSQEPLFRGNDPNQLPLGLKGQNTVRVQEKIVRPDSAYNLSIRRGVGRHGG